MEQYICYAPSKEQFDFKGNSLGHGEELALCYSPLIGRRRIYRNSLMKPDKGLKVLIFKNKNIAQLRCDEANEISGEKRFYPKLYEAVVQ